jgi:hypothetical protein
MKNETAEKIRRWMLDVLNEHPEVNATQWARAAGVAHSTVLRAIKPDYEFVTSSTTIAKLAKALNVQPPSLNAGNAPAPIIEPNFLGVRFKVQAGMWLEIDDMVEIGLPPLPVLPNPKFGRFPQWLELVDGDSANLKVSPGAYVHVVDAIDMGYAPRQGDWVIAERIRNQGGLRERTLKQVEITPTGVQLWPRSTNPKWSTPLQLAPAGANDTDMVVQIVGLVIGAYNVF